MICDRCAAREKAEGQQRANCETERKRLDKQSQRLTIALTALATLVGKETLDRAMSIFDTVGEVTNLASAETSATSETYITSPSYYTETPEPDVADVADVAWGMDLYTPQLDNATWHVAGSYLPGYGKPDMSLFTEDLYSAAVPEPTPLWFIPMWALTPKRKR